jgi:hypothetical protein
LGSESCQLNYQQPRRNLRVRLAATNRVASAISVTIKPIVSVLSNGEEWAVTLDMWTHQSRTACT